MFGNLSKTLTLVVELLRKNQASRLIGRFFIKKNVRKNFDFFRFADNAGNSLALNIYLISLSRDRCKNQRNP